MIKFYVYPSTFPFYVFLAFVCLVLVLMICNIFRLEAAVLDLVADDGAGMKKQRSVFHWDKVMLNS